MSRTLIISLIAASVFTIEPVRAQDATATDAFLPHFTGRYSTAAQAEETLGEFTMVNFVGCEVRLHDTAPVPGIRYIYEERNFWTRPVHYQRILKLETRADGTTVDMRIHRTTDDAGLLGLCDRPAEQRSVRAEHFKPSECTQSFTEESGKWRGVTPPEGCPSRWFPGSVYMTSEAVIDPAMGEIQVWGRFYDAQGQQVGGVGEVPYFYRRVSNDLAEQKALAQFLQRLVGVWNTTRYRTTPEGERLDSQITKESFTLDNTSARLETVNNPESANAETSLAEGALTPDGRLVLAEGNRTSVCRLQSRDMLFCSSWTDRDAASRELRKELTVLADDGERTSHGQLFVGDALSEFFMAQSRRQAP